MSMSTSELEAAMKNLRECIADEEDRDARLSMRLMLERMAQDLNSRATPEVGK